MEVVRNHPSCPHLDRPIHAFHLSHAISFGSKAGCDYSILKPWWYQIYCGTVAIVRFVQNQEEHSGLDRDRQLQAVPCWLGRALRCPPICKAAAPGDSVAGKFTWNRIQFSAYSNSAVLPFFLTELFCFFWPYLSFFFEELAALCLYIKRDVKVNKVCHKMICKQSEIATGFFESEMPVWCRHCKFASSERPHHSSPLG